MTANTGTSNAYQVTIDGPYNLVMTSGGDTIQYYNGASSGNVQRLFNYQITNFSQTNVGTVVTLCEVPTYTWTCQESDPGDDANWCPNVPGKTAKTTTSLSNGQYIDGWSLTTGSYTPPSGSTDCGSSNFVDPWSFIPQGTTLDELGKPYGYIYRNSVENDGVISTIANPQIISAGTTMPR